MEDGTQLGQILFLWNTKSLGGSEFTKEIYYNIRFLKKHWQADARNKLYFELGTIA